MTSLNQRKYHYPVDFLYNREMGNPFPLGLQDYHMKSCYSVMVPKGSFEPLTYKCPRTVGAHGGIFNLEFSPDGSMMIAACEAKCALIYDPLCQRQIKVLENAHTDCVNCIRFLDSRMFATCSDDTTVALWDIRNLKSKIRSLVGHSNWVKNIEYSKNERMLLTSGFDGSIYTWDINSYTEEGLIHRRIFHTNGLMRTRLVPSEKKLVICTTGGYLIIIHDLDLDTIPTDLAGFKPNMYRLMQLSNTAIPLASNYSHLFTAKRNRVELVTDFPTDNDAEVISSLQVHPQGWCVLSRNTSTDELSEWSCVHDIQDIPKSEQEAMDTEESPEGSVQSEDVARPASAPPREGEETPDRGSFLLQSTDRVNSLSELFNIGQLRVTSSEVMEALQIIQEARFGGNNSSQSLAFQLVDGSTTGDHDSDATPTALLVRRGNRSSRTLLFLGGNRLSRNPSLPSTHKIHKSVPRLTHFIEEPNVGRGFIKEQCFSADGRLLCSPYGEGVRLLSFNPECSELSNCVFSGHSQLLRELTTNICHSNVVVSTKFSPSHCLLVSGCLSGKIVWHQPDYNLTSYT